MATSGASSPKARTVHCPLSRPSQTHSAPSAKTVHSKTASQPGCTVPYGMAVKTMSARSAQKIDLSNQRATLIRKGLLGPRRE